MDIRELRRLFDSIDLEQIERFVSEQQQEYLNLEFKLLAGNDRFNREDRRNLAAALSGFANSDGGVLVWGIQTDPVDGVDTAVAKRPLQNLLRVRSEVESLTGEVVSPVVDGVVHKTVPESPGGSSGYLVTLVPEAIHGPHMAKGGEYRYYKRSGDSFYRMEHFDIEDMFGRRPQARLSLFTAVRREGGSSGPQGGSYQMAVTLGVANGGRELARFPYLALRIHSPYHLDAWGLDGNGNTGLPRLPSGDPVGEWSAFGGGADHVVHIGSTLEVTKVRRSVGARDSTCPDVVIDYKISADGVPSFEGQHVVKGEAILRTAYPDDTSSPMASA